MQNTKKQQLNHQLKIVLELLLKEGIVMIFWEALTLVTVGEGYPGFWVMLLHCLREVAEVRSRKGQVY